MDARHGVTMFRKLNVLVGDGVVGDGVVGWWETGWWGGGRRGGGMVGDGVVVGWLVLGKACTSHFIISSPSCPSMTSLSFQALGMVASMSYFTCSACSNCATIVGHGGAHHAAAHLPGLLQPRCWISFLTWQRWVANTVASKAAAPLLSASIRLLKRSPVGRCSFSPSSCSHVSTPPYSSSLSTPLLSAQSCAANEAEPCRYDHGVAELLPNTPLTRKQRAYVMEDHHPHIAGDNVLKISSGVLLRRLKICG
ncbi:unnamed protein product [Closterium sp. NIES-64]|nr:unnamed protein product [Closterium sp. NIES-64]